MRVQQELDETKIVLVSRCDSEGFRGPTVPYPARTA